MLSLAFGTVEFGYYFYVEHTMQVAAREGARAGAVYQPGDIPNGALDEGTRKSLAIGAVNTVMTNAKLSNYTTVADFIPVNGKPAIRVTLQANWDQIGLRPMGMIKAGHKVEGQAVMIAE